MLLPDPSLPWSVPLSAVALIAENERSPLGDVALVAYRCPAGIWTIGWGETDGVRAGDRCTREEADRWLCEDLAERARAVLDLCKIKPSPNELGAMVSLAYNIGLGGFAKSSVLRAHNAGDWQSASRAFGLWNKAKHPVTGELRELPGLTSRRAREAAMYLQPEPGESLDPMPQAVEPESKPLASPIVRSGAATVAAGVVTTLAKAADDFGLGSAMPIIKQAREFLGDVLGVPSGWLLPILIIATGAMVIRWRLKQREGGWA